MRKIILITLLTIFQVPNMAFALTSTECDNASKDKETCIKLGGCVYNDADGSCKICAPNTYGDNGKCKTCPDTHPLSAEGSAGINSCYKTCGALTDTQPAYNGKNCNCVDNATYNSQTGQCECNSGFVSNTDQTACVGKVSKIELKKNNLAFGKDYTIYVKYSVGFAKTNSANTWGSNISTLGVLQENRPIKRFNGYFTDEKATNQIFNSNGAFVSGKNINNDIFKNDLTLYAGWNTKSYAITYKYGDNSYTRGQTCSEDKPCSALSASDMPVQWTLDGRYITKWKCTVGDSETACTQEYINPKDTITEPTTDDELKRTLTPVLVACEKGYYCPKGEKEGCPMGSTTDDPTAATETDPIGKGATSKTQCYIFAPTTEFCETPDRCFIIGDLSQIKSKIKYKSL